MELFPICVNWAYPSWIYEFFQQPIHRNECKENWQMYFDEIPICLNKYHLILTGKKENTRPLVLIQIMECHSGIPFKGLHTIFFPMSHHTTQITSFGKLKRAFFTDRVSFERSTYLCLWEQQKLIRLKNIRAYITFPHISNTLEKQVTQRTIQQLQTALRTIYSAFQRDLIGEEPETIKKKLEEAITVFLPEL